jgi:hypothetical protein
VVTRCQVVQARQPGQGSGREKLEVKRGVSRTVQPPSFPTTFGLRATTWGDLNPQAYPSLQDAHRTEQLPAFCAMKEDSHWG